MNSVDSFIESSLELLAAYPSTAIVSITYANETKKSKSNTTTSNNDDKKATNSVKVKVYEPHSGKCIRYKTYKTKELSKLMTFLGPKGVTLTQSKPQPKKRLLPINNSDHDNDMDESNKKAKIDNHIPGIASVMANKTFDSELAAPADVNISNNSAEPVPESSAKEASIEPETNSKNKKKKKKKGKK